MNRRPPPDLRRIADLWPALPPPPGFADRVLEARHRPPPPPTATAPWPAPRWRAPLVAVAVALVAAILLIPVAQRRGSGSAGERLAAAPLLAPDLGPARD